MSDFPEKENREQEALQPEAVTAPEEEVSTVFSDPAEHKKTVVKQKKRLLPAVVAAVLAVAVLAGGTVAVIKLIPEREENSSSPSIETITVLEENSDEYKTVTVTNENGTFKLYSAEEAVETDSSDSSEEDTEVNWYLDGYDKDVIDSDMVGYIAAYADTLEAVREVTAKSAAECGLDTPAVKVDVVKNDGSEFSILIGDESPDNTGIYVKLSTDDKIYISESDLKEDFTFDALSLADTSSVSGVTVTDNIKYYADDDGALTTFDTITLTGENFPEKVVLAPNTDESVAQYAAYVTLSPTNRIADNVEGIFDLFKSGVSVSGAYSFDTSASALKLFGLNDPDLIATIKMGTFTATYSFKQQEDGDYAIWYDGAKLIKKVSASSLSFIDYKLSDYYSSWVCLQSINDLSNFTVKTSEKTYSFDIVYDDSEDAEETYVITYQGEKLVASDFQGFYEECVSLSCTDYTVDKVDGEPTISFVFTFSDTSREKICIEFRKSGETKYQYRIDGVDMGKVNSSSINKILRSVKTLTDEINS